jgi:DNA polymerase III delta prime subunit
VVKTQSSPSPTLAKPDDPSHNEPESQTDAGHTGIERSPGASHLPELPSVEQADDKVHVASSPLGSSQGTADVDIGAPAIHWPFLVLTGCTGQSQGCYSLNEGHVPSSSPSDLSSAAHSSPTDAGLVTISNSPEPGLHSPVSSPASSLPNVIDLSMEQGTADTPIVIEESPICEIPILTLPFQSPPLRKRKQLKRNSLDAPFPNASTQHIRDSVMTVHATPIGLVRRRRKTSQVPLDSDLSLPRLEEAPNVDKHKHQNELTRSHRRVRSSEHQVDSNAILSCDGDLYPAVSSIFELASELQNVKETQQNWCQKWRPRRAEHVLGNERNACYLREWMHALRLHFDRRSSSAVKVTKSRRVHKKRKRGGQRPEVVREVTRKRKKAGDLDGWIVDDEDDDDDCLDDDYGVLDNFDDGSLPSSQEPSEPRPISFGKKIRNTILLVGPPGCGKTAAVYACAEELGWNVFEVYPGIGKRGGTHLDDLIGDVGKNHTLPQPLHFHRGRSEPPSPVKRRTTTTADTFDPTPETGNHPQSAVLIEEADVVFADEAGFWPSVVAFIRDSRRPVIITCNGRISVVSGGSELMCDACLTDVSLIPIETLPLQATLTFSLPPMSLISPLLNAICQVEGRPTAELENSHIEGQVHTADLRQCISQCQLGLPDSDTQNLGQQPDTAADVIFSLRVKADIPTVMELEPDMRRNLCVLRQSFRGADLASYLDACVLLSHVDASEVAETHSDDQVGHKALKATQRTNMPAQTEYHSRDLDMTIATLRSFEGVVERCFPDTLLDNTPGIAPSLSRDEYRSRLWEGLRTDPALECLVDLPGLYLDYRPLIGVMVAEEDKEIERAAERVKGRSGRQTQNSQKRQEDDVRWLNAREELRGAVRAGGLCCSW